jgi:hypothetical protein
MKLAVLHEQGDPFGNWLKEKLQRRISKGSSRLKEVLHGDQYSLDHVRLAIDKSVCLKNLGPTYLEQTISNLLRDLVQSNELPMAQLNDARAYFHLNKMTPAELRQEKAKAQKART